MKIIGPSTSVREGDSALVECVAYGSKPAAAIVWRNGSRILDNGREAKTIEEKNADGITVNTRSSLEIVVSHHDHLNPIFCEAANVAMRAPINKSTEISVLCKYSFPLLLPPRVENLLPTFFFIFFSLCITSLH